MFRRMGVNNARLLDIHYPARHTAAVLIHNDFESELIGLLTKHRVSHNENFSTNSGSILEDPNLRDLSTTERNEIARRHQTTRLERAVQRIRAPVKYAFYDSLASDRYPQIGSIFNQTPDTSSPPLPDDIGQVLLDDDLNMSDEAAPGSPQH
ncbi:hypothetical protein G6F45_013498 [Rhizopus arrhizus]|nr:hypothetical protein G6F45_013498 [Rhizopus arrhizus]